MKHEINSQPDENRKEASESMPGSENDASQHSYPMLSNWITVNDDGSGTVTVKNELTDKVYSTDKKALEFLRSLDGRTDPYLLPPNLSMGYSGYEIAEMLGEFSAAGLVRNSRYFDETRVSRYRTVFIPRKQISDAPLWKILNMLILLSFLPVFILGVLSFLSGLDTIRLNISNMWGIVSGIFVGFLLGGILHECGHAVAALATGGRVFEMGLSFHYLIIPGAYASIKENDSSPRLQKAQVSAAGMEMNMLIIGIALILMNLIHYGTGFLFAIAVVNLLLVLDNVLLVHNVDGCWVYSHMHGLDYNIADAARNMLFTKEKRQKLISEGCCGKASLCTYCLILFLQAAGFAFVIISLISLVSIFLWR